MKSLKLISVYLSFLFIFSLIYILLFHSPLFKNIDILFYRGIILLAVTGLFFLLAFIFLRKKIGAETFLAALAMSLSLNLAFFVVFPVTFERSVTMFFLRNLNKVSSLSHRQSQDLLIEKYIRGKDAVEKRVHEQAVTGFINEKNGQIKITNKGKKFIRFSQIIDWIYGVSFN